MAIAAAGLLSSTSMPMAISKRTHAKITKIAKLKLFSIDRCPCCDSTAIKRHVAILSPFILDYVLEKSRLPPTRLNECRRCGHRLYRHRFTDDEMTNLYQGYRGERYFQARNKVEPWYTREVNKCNLSADIIDSRKQGLMAFLEKWLDTRGGRGSIIADIGGDAGQLIPLEAASEAYVVEASDQPPVAGVKRVGNLEEIQAPVSLLMCCHVLEHLSLPAEFLSSLAKSRSLAPDCLVYLEVPLENWKILPGMNNWLYSAYLSSLQRIRPLLIIIDFISTAMRGYAGLAMPPAFMKLHEHINYFSPKSLSSLAEVAGLNVLEVKVEKGSALATHQGVIRMACRTSAA